MTNLTTNAQRLLLKNWIVANNGGVFDQSAVAALNANATPVYKVVRSTLGKHDLIELTDKDAADADTAFAIGGGTGSFIDRSVGERDGWREMFNSVLSCKPSLALVRIAFFDIFSGAAALAAQNRKHFWARSQRPATVAEKLLAVATVGGPRHDATSGSNPAGQTGVRGSWTNPDTLTAEGKVTLDEVILSETAS